MPHSDMGQAGPGVTLNSVPNDLARIGAEGVQTMSSREIAELCEKQHGHVMRDIRDMLVQLYPESDQSKFGGYYIAENGKQNPCFNLPKRETLILVSGYRLDLRAKIIDRWQELEEAARTFDPSRLSRMEILGLALAAEKELVEERGKRIELEHANAELAPKAEALDRISGADGSYCVTDAAKALQMRPKDLFTYLRGPAQWIYRRLGNPEDIAYQPRIQQGYLEYRTTTIYRPDGSEKSVSKVRITAKGLAKLAEIFAKRDLH